MVTATTQTLARRGARGRGLAIRLDADDAFIALLIAAIEASGHVSPAEAERAHNLIWSTRRFRRRSGERVGRQIEEMKVLSAREIKKGASVWTLRDKTRRPLWSGR